MNASLDAQLAEQRAKFQERIAELADEALNTDTDSNTDPRSEA